MNLNRQYFTGLLLIVSFAIILVVTCGGDKVTNPVSFAPGKYKGIYRVARHWQTPNEVINVDTMIFTFASPDTFRLGFSSDDLDTHFCEAYGEYLFGNDSLKLSDVTLKPYICETDATPEAEYQYFVEGGIMIFKTSDTAMNRRIELWNKIN